MTSSTEDVASLAVGPLTAEDVPVCQRVFDAAYLDLHARYGLRVDEPSESDWLAPILSHFLDTDPSGSVIAKGGDGVAVAFGCSFRRDDYWFLSFLFVVPEWQGRGLGRLLLRELLPGGAAVRATVVESFQPASTGLYAAAGIAPRSLKYWIHDFRRADELPLLPGHVARRELTPDDVADIDDLDRAILGFARPADHLWWRNAGQRCFCYRRHEELIAYAYVDESFVGPVLAVDQQVLCFVVADLVRTSGDPNGMSVNLSGHSDQLFRMLIDAGGRIDDQDPYRFVYCSTAGALPASYIHHSDWLP